MERVAFSSWNGKIVDNRKGKTSKISKSAVVNFPKTPGKMAALLGWGGLVVADPKADVTSLTLGYLKEARKLSCGECSVCMIGIERLLDLFAEIAEGDGDKTDLAEMENIIKFVSDNSQCAYGQSALIPVLDVIKYYKTELLSLIKGETKLQEKE